MIIKIEFDSEIPIYEQLKRQIIIGIAKGELNPKDRLPSIRELGEDLGINLHTVRKSYNILKSEGYVTMDRRRGAEVSENFNTGIEEFQELINSDLEYLVANAKNRGLKEKDILELCTNYYRSYKGGNCDD